MPHWVPSMSRAALLLKDARRLTPRHMILHLDSTSICSKVHRGSRCSFPSGRPGKASGSRAAALRAGRRLEGPVLPRSQLRRRQIPPQVRSLHCTLRFHVYPRTPACNASQALPSGQPSRSSGIHASLMRMLWDLGFIGAGVGRSNAYVGLWISISAIDNHASDPIHR